MNRIKSSRGRVSVAVGLAWVIGVASCGDEPRSSGGDGGSGGEQVTVCTPGESQPCYDGPIESKDVGICHSGEKKCLPDGSGFGVCEGAVMPAVETCDTPDDDDCDGSAECHGIHLWSQIFGTPNSDWIGQVAVDDAGNIVFVGRIETAYDFGGGPVANRVVVKLDPAGKHIWSKSIPTGTPQSVALDKQGNVLVGTVGCHVAKLTAAGDLAWSKDFGCDDISSTYVAADGSGNVLVAGDFSQQAPDFGGGPTLGGGAVDVFVAKLDPAGNHTWSKGFGDGSSQGASGVVADAAGNLIVLGEFEGAIDFGGGPLQAVTLSDIFVAKLGPAGDHIWSKGLYGKDYFDYCDDIAIDGAGNVVITGIFSGELTVDGTPFTAANMGNPVFLVKLDGAGKLVWGKVFEGDAYPDVAVSVDAAGDVFAAGAFQGVIQLGDAPLGGGGSHGFYLGRFDAAGNHVWSKGFPMVDDSNGFPEIRAASNSAGSALVVVGKTLDPVDLGGGPLTPAQFGDIFIGRLTP